MRNSFEDPPTAAESHGSPGLAAIVSSLGSAIDFRVLDLGPAVPANIRFYGAFARHVRVVDAVRELSAHVAEDEDGGSFERLLEGSWRGVEGEFQLVMAWDLFSHLDPDPARQVLSRIRDVCGPGSMLYLLTYTGATMPAAPQVFEISTRDTVVYRPPSSEVIPTRDLPPATVDRLLKGFEIETSFLLRHGVREFAAIRV